MQKEKKGKKETQTMARFNKIILKNDYLSRCARFFVTPYMNGAFNIIHCCHHRVGTAWFTRIMNAVAMKYYLPFVKRDRIDKSPLLPGAPFIYLDTHSLLDVSEITSFRGTHIIRDPRDIVISGYYYHLWTDEEWANMKFSTLLKEKPMLKSRLASLPLDAIMDMSYKEYLNKLPKEEGLLVEIKRASLGPIQIMTDWDYDNPNFLEIKYEDLLLDQEKTFRKIFFHYGFKSEAIDISTEIALSYSFKKITGRSIGEVGKKSHLRSGKVNQWEEEFSQSHIDLFKELHGSDLIKLGYEVGLDW
ncbi:MAG: hypothetical protein HKM93_13380 [Desulfobacteraceae bacterium]|nr:hypothetical protein [Desulfobacteraceae bacterium]